MNEDDLSFLDPSQNQDQTNDQGGDNGQSNNDTSNISNNSPTNDNDTTQSGSSSQEIRKIKEEKSAVNFLDDKGIEDEEEVLRLMKERFAYCQNFFDPIHEKMYLDFDFYKGNQWEEEEMKRRAAMGRPCESFNIINQFVDKMVSQVRQNPPSITVNSSDVSTNKKTTQVISAYLHKLEKDSYAQRAYVRAVHNSSICGLGGIRLNLEYKNNKDFTKTFKIEAITSPFSFYFDPKFDDNLENMEYAFTFEKITLDEFKEQYPDFYEDNELKYQYVMRDNKEDWIEPDTVRIAEYFYKERVSKMLFQLENGTNVFKDDYKKNNMSSKVIRKRKVQVTRVRWIKTNGIDILEQSLFPTSFIPVAPVFGNYLNVDGIISFEGVVRQLIPVQKAFNYIHNKEIEMVSSMAIGKYLVPEGSVEGYEADWNSINTSNKPYIQYKTVNSEGQQQSQPQPITQQYNMDVTSAMLARSVENAKAVTGIYDPALGKENTGEVSGVALMAKQEQSQSLGYKYLDSLSDTLEYVGKAIIDGIAYVIDDNTIVSIVGEDGINTVNVNMVSDPDVDLFNANLSVETNISLSNETTRQQAIRSLFALIQLNPDVMMPLVAPKLVELQDFSGSTEISTMMKQKFGTDDENQQVQEQMQQMQAQFEQQMQQAQAQFEQQMQAKDSELKNQQILISNATAEYNNLNNKAEFDKMKNEAEKKASNESNAIKMIDTLLKNGLTINSPQVSHFFEIAYGISTYNARLQQGLNNADPDQVMQDELVIPGVNDPITEQNQSQVDDEQNRQDLMNLNDMIDKMGIQNNIEEIPRTTLGSY